MGKFEAKFRLKQFIDLIELRETYKMGKMDKFDRIEIDSKLNEKFFKRMGWV